MKQALADAHIPKRRQQYHRLLCLKLSADGPSFFANTESSSTVGLRKLGYTYYDESFATSQKELFMVGTGTFINCIIYGQLRNLREKNYLWSAIDHSLKNEIWSAPVLF